jgi:hypothetical protein
MGLRLRLILVLMVPLTLVVGVYGYIRVEQEAAGLLEDNRRALAFTAKALQVAVENALRDRQMSDASRLLSEVVQYQEEIDRIRIFDRTLTPLLVSNRLPIGDDVPTEALMRALERNVSEGLYYTRGTTPVLYYVVPIRGRGESPQAVMELVQVATGVEARVAAAQTDVWTRLGVLVVSIAALSGLILQKQVLKPVARLVDGIRRVGAGETGARLPVERRDELGRVASAFNEMAAKLQAARRELLAESERTLELEAELRRMETLAVAGKLATGFAHEIGTPLNVISGRAEYVLGRLPEDDPARKDLVGIIDQIDRISGIIVSLLDTLRPQKPDLGPVRLSDVFDRLVPLVAHAARRKEVGLDVETPADLPAVFADRHQLQQVVLNLLVNAIEASPPGGRIDVSSAAVERDGRPGVGIRVSDSGPGVAPELRAAVFKPFFTTKPRGQGTGLGLAICRDILREHEGTIELEDRGSGATFVVWLPAVETA